MPVQIGIFDTSTLINIFCSGSYASILKGIGLRCKISPKVIKESNYYYDKGIKTKLELNQFVSQGLFEIEPLNENDYADYINLASILDDGEAETIAIGINRGWAIVTDDRKAIKIIKGLNPYIEILCTPILINKWAKNTNPKFENVKKVISNIESYARFRPSDRNYYEEYFKNGGICDWWWNIGPKT